MIKDGKHDRPDGMKIGISSSLKVWVKTQVFVDFLSSNRGGYSDLRKKIIPEGKCCYRKGIFLKSQYMISKVSPAGSNWPQMILLETGGG